MPQLGAARPRRFLAQNPLAHNSHDAQVHAARPLIASPSVARRGRNFVQPGMSADPTLEFLTSELSSEDPSKCVECISRLQVVALSLGAEKTVSLLIPYLAAQTENVRRRLELAAQNYPQLRAAAPGAAARHSPPSRPRASPFSSRTRCS